MARGRLVYRSPNVEVRFDLNEQGIAKIALGAPLLAAVMDLADAVAKPYAVSISPRSSRRHVHYQDSFVTIPGTAWIAGMKRVAARLYNISPQAIIVEKGFGQQAGHEVLRRTLDHLNTLGPEVP